MTNEEAIRSMRNLDDVISITESEHESVKTAISALEHNSLLIEHISNLQNENTDFFNKLVESEKENTKLKAEIDQLKEKLEQFKNIHKSSMAEIGMEVFVITQYGTHEKEIIKCKVNRKTLKSKITFSVNGLYKNFNYYNGTFTDSSIGKKVFLTREEAEQALKGQV